MRNALVTMRSMAQEDTVAARQDEYEAARRTPRARMTVPMMIRHQDMKRRERREQREMLLQHHDVQRASRAASIAEQDYDRVGNRARLSGDERSLTSGDVQSHRGTIVGILARDNQSYRRTQRNVLWNVRKELRETRRQLRRSLRINRINRASANVCSTNDVTVQTNLAGGDDETGMTEVMNAIAPCALPDERDAMVRTIRDLRTAGVSVHDVRALLMPDRTGTDEGGFT